VEQQRLAGRSRGIQKHQRKFSKHIIGLCILPTKEQVNLAPTKKQNEIESKLKEIKIKTHVNNFSRVLSTIKLAHTHIKPENG